MSRRLLAASIVCLLAAPAAVAQTRPAATRPASRPIDPAVAKEIDDWNRAVASARNNFVEWSEVDPNRLEVKYWWAALEHAKARVALLQSTDPAERERLADDVARFRVEHLKLKAEYHRQGGLDKLVPMTLAEAVVVELERKAAKAGDRATAVERRDLVAAQLRFAKLSLEYTAAEKLNDQAHWEQAVAELTAELKAAEERVAAEGGAATKPAGGGR